MYRRTSSFGWLTAAGLVLLHVMLLPGCDRSSRGKSTPQTGSAPDSNPVAPARPITLATTTSTQDSGLLDALLPKFRAMTGIDVKVVAVGSGQAMELGRRGDADLLMVHSPEMEEQFMRDGYGVDRRPLMYNDFVIVGPPDDSAAIQGTASAVEALRKISGSSARFVSRADKSGTHAKEQSLWKKAQLDPQGEWYLKAGSGMEETLRVADEKRAYTLADRATYLAHLARLNLAVLVEGDDALLNHYSVIRLNPAKYPHLNHDGANRFVAFLFSEDARQIIAHFGREQFGQPLFFLP